MAFRTKMEGVLCHWALAMEEYSFDIVYRKGSLNGNADALSRLSATTSSPVAMTSATPKITDIQQAQRDDSLLQELLSSIIKITRQTSKSHKETTSS